MSIYIIIPARYGSSRFPGKPLTVIKGLPMIQRVMERAKQATGIKLVAVATDNELIAKTVKNFGGQVVMTPSNLRTGTDRVAAAAQSLNIDEQDLVINVQGDQPLLPLEIIHEIISPLLYKTEILISTPVIAITSFEEINNPNCVKVVMNNNGNALYFSRQAIPFFRDNNKGIYYKHLGIYAYRKFFLDKFTKLPTGRLEFLEKLEQLRILEAGYCIHCVITQFDSPEVDQPEDIQRVNNFLNQMIYR